MTAPICKGCNHPVLVVHEEQHEYIRWVYNEETDRLEKQDTTGDSDGAKHKCDLCPCEYEMEMEY